jgi:hypothetical protein
MSKSNFDFERTVPQYTFILPFVRNDGSSLKQSKEYFNLIKEAENSHELHQPFISGESEHINKNIFESA